MNRITILSFLLYLWPLFAITSCGTLEAVAGVEEPVTINQLRFLGSYEVPYNMSFRNTTIGGLSGIEYDSKRQVYYLICDDRSAINPARFYTAKIYLNERGIDSTHFVGVTTLLQSDGQPFPNTKEDPFHTPDPEALRYNLRKDQLIWASEGERIVQKEKVVLEDPALMVCSRNGTFIDSFPLPVQMRMSSSEKGPRQNGTFEGLAFAEGFQALYVSMEEPIYEDGPRAGLADSTAWIRITKYDVATHTPVSQLAYKIEPVAYPPVPAGAFAINGVSDILAVNNQQLLVVERSFSTGHANNTVRLFLANVADADDVSSTVSLRIDPPEHPVKKKLLFNMDKLKIGVDNIEGVTFGPLLPNGNRTLLFVADNNFSATQKNQFLLFEIK